MTPCPWCDAGDPTSVIPECRCAELEARQEEIARVLGDTYTEHDGI